MLDFDRIWRVYIWPFGFQNLVAFRNVVVIQLRFHAQPRPRFGGLNVSAVRIRVGHHADDRLSVLLSRRTAFLDPVVASLLLRPFVIVTFRILVLLVLGPSVGRCAAACAAAAGSWPWSGRRRNSSRRWCFRLLENRKISNPPPSLKKSARTTMRTGGATPGLPLQTGGGWS